MIAPPITYKHPYLVDPSVLFQTLAHLDWVRRENTPRSEYYVNDIGTPYTYGMGLGRRTYEPQEKTEAIAAMQRALHVETGTWFDVCFLNRYLDGKDQLGWHADDSLEMSHDHPIAIVSLGSPREIWFKQKLGVAPSPRTGQLLKPQPNPVTKLLLENGSLCLMAAGMQRDWFHRIPKADRPVDGRISMTWRVYAKEKP